MVLGACEVLTKWLCTHYLPVITEALIHYSGAVHLRSLLPQIFHVDRSARSLPSCESSLNLLDLLLLVISEKPVTVDISPSLKFITTDWSGELLRTCWALYLSWRWTDKIGQVQSLRTVVLISNWNDFLTIRRVRHRCWWPNPRFGSTAEFCQYILFNPFFTTRHSPSLSHGSLRLCFSYLTAQVTDGQQTWLSVNLNRFKPS